MIAETPSDGHVAEPGLSVLAPGTGPTIVDPVSDCHHVSTIGACPRPKFRWNHTHASGLIASPTEPSRRIDDRSWPGGMSSPNHVMNVRMSVGAV
jgi:hypothetical protein